MEAPPGGRLPAARGPHVRAERDAPREPWPAPSSADDRGTLAQQLDRPAPLGTGERGALPSRTGRRPGHRTTGEPSVPPLTLANGLGGFTDGGREYVIVLEGDQETPQPWANVIASPGLGTIVTASGSAFTWSENSRENRLTPFANDPVTDPTAEALFVRDDETGAAWSPTPGPLPRTSTQRPLRGPPRGGRHPASRVPRRHPP